MSAASGLFNRSGITKGQAGECLWLWRGQCAFLVVFHWHWPYTSSTEARHVCQRPHKCQCCWSLMQFMVELNMGNLELIESWMRRHLLAFNSIWLFHSERIPSVFINSHGYKLRLNSYLHWLLHKDTSMLLHIVHNWIICLWIINWKILIPKLFTG